MHIKFKKIFEMQILNISIGKLSYLGHLFKSQGKTSLPFPYTIFLLIFKNEKVSLDMKKYPW